MSAVSSVLRTCLVPIVLLLVAAGLAGCNGTIAAIEPALRAGASDEEGGRDGRRMIGEPYKVGGRWFHPREDEDYDETGLASWYGPGFHGKPTANGERFDQNGLTAAHPTLPLPSYVRVTVVDSGKSAVLRLNDRGPFKRGRIIDVSYAAAKKLGFKHRGTAKVRVEYLGPAPIGGGDRETLMAAAEYGEQSEEGGRSLRDFWPFGRKDEEDDGRDVEVRVASAEPARGSTPPGVRVASTATSAPRQGAPEPSITTPSAPSSAVTAVAYQPPAAPSDEDGAIDALIEMNAEPVQAASGPAPAAPLPAAELAATDERIMGAHDLFAAIDDASGGAGELRGAGQSE